MVQIIPAAHRKPSFGERINQSLEAGLNTGSRLVQEHQRNKAITEALGPEAANLPPEFQKMAYEAKLKGLETAQKLKSNEKTIRSIEKERGLEEGSLQDLIHDPKLAEQLTRTPKKTQASQPIDPEQLNIIQKVRSTPGYDGMDEVDQYRALTNAGVSKENAEVESKLTGTKLERQQKGFESAYKAQEEFINDTTKSYKAFETDTKPKLMQMQHMPSEDIVGPTAAAFLDTLGIPLGALEDPSSELYQKLSFDLLKGLPETYGNRILKVEVDNFLKTIPSLLNSPEGRRMIASNMLKLGEMKEVYYNEMRKQQRDSLDNQKPLARDFQQNVFDQVKPQIERINKEFVKMSEIKSVPKDTIPFFGPTGEIEFVPKEHAQWALENGGKRIW